MGALPDAQDDAAVTEVRAAMKRIFATRDTEAWEAFFRARDDVIVERILDHAEVAADPQTLANDYVVPMVLAGVGEARVVGNSVQLSATPGSLKGPPPDLGDATEAVMRELGFSAEEIDQVQAHSARVRAQLSSA